MNLTFLSETLHHIPLSLPNTSPHKINSLQRTTKGEHNLGAESDILLAPHESLIKFPSFASIFRTSYTTIGRLFSTTFVSCCFFSLFLRRFTSFILPSRCNQQTLYTMSYRIKYHSQITLTQQRYLTDCHRNWWKYLRQLSTIQLGFTHVRLPTKPKLSSLVSYHNVHTAFHRIIIPSISTWFTKFRKKKVQQNTRTSHYEFNVWLISDNQRQDSNVSFQFFQSVETNAISLKLLVVRCESRPEFLTKLFALLS